MKKNTSHLGVSCCLAFFLLSTVVLPSCSKKEEHNALSQQLRESLSNEAELFSTGKATIEILSDTQIAVFQSEAGNDNIDRVIVLEGEQKFSNASIPQGDLEESDVYYFKDRRAVIIHAKSKNKLILLALDESESRLKSRLITSNAKLQGELTSVFGYGLSANKGIWNKKTLANREKDKDIFNVLALTLLEKPKAKSFGLNSVTDLAGAECTSGGVGSTQCSITEAFPPNESCEVTCRDGYYACCKSNTVRCNCEPNPPPEDED